MGVDSFDYYCSFLFWFLFASVSILSNLIQSYFFFNHLTKEKKFKTKTKFNDNSTNYLNISTFSKKDYKWFIITWINNPNFEQNFFFSNALKTLFSSNKSLFWSTHFDFFIKLYRSVYFLNLSTHSSIYSTQFLMEKIKPSNNLDLLIYLNNSNSFTKFSSIIMFFLNNKNENFFSSSQKIQKLNNFAIKKNQWNVIKTDFFYENSYLLKKLNGFFYFDDFSAIQLTNLFKKNKNLNLTATLLNDQINSAKWNRWLYKYSVFHRKTFKNTHKITISKKLLNSDFSNTDLSFKNLWYSEFFNKNNEKNLIHFTSNFFADSSINLNFQNFNKNSTLTNSSYRTFFFLNSYENSFFWFFKKSYFFTNLFNNVNLSKIIKNKSQTNFYENNNLNSSFFWNTYFNKSIFLSLKNLNHVGNLNLFFLKKTKNNSNEIHNDIFMLFEDLDLFDRDNLEILNCVVTPSTYTNNFQNSLSIFFNLQKNNVSSLKFYKFVNLPTSAQFKNDSFLLKSLNNLDNVYLNDLIIFFFLQK